MVYDKDKVDYITLALLYLVMSGNEGEERALKCFDAETMSRLHEKGYISDPRTEAKSVRMSPKGAELALELFRKHFAPDHSAGRVYSV